MSLIVSAFESIQRYRVRERGVHGGGVTPLHTNAKKEKTELQSITNIKGLHSSSNAVVPWGMKVFYLTGSRFFY